MPINNDILGIYKAVFIRTSGGGTGYSYIVESASRSITIDASPKTMMIGSPKTRIMDIGGASESISIQAPILIGGGSSIQPTLVLQTAPVPVKPSQMRVQHSIDSLTLPPRNALLS
jgi:hypothetical protein